MYPSLVVHCCHSIHSFFGSRAGEFVVIIKAYDARVKPTETSVREEFVGSVRAEPSRAEFLCCSFRSRFNSARVLPLLTRSRVYSSALGDLHIARQAHYLPMDLCFPLRCILPFLIFVCHGSPLLSRNSFYTIALLAFSSQLFTCLFAHYNRDLYL